MSKITYANKVAINENPEIPDINKVTDNDMNEIKTVVNNNDDELITINTNLTNATTYSTTETVVGTWMGKPLYRKVLDVGSKTFSSGDNYIEHGIYNFERAINLKYTMFFGNSNYVLWDKLLTLQATSTNIIASTTGSNSFTQVYFILEYTKTTD